MRVYFEVKLTDGRILDFDKGCNNIEYSNDNYTIFKHVIDERAYKILAIIPHKSIYLIMRKEDR